MLRIFDHKTGGHRPPLQSRAALALALILSATLFGRPQIPGSYETAIRPVIQQTCAQCHNETIASGGLNLKAMDRESLVSQRAVWETVLGKLKAGEMPPSGTP